LPTENAEAVQADFDGWVTHYQPVGPDEFALVEDIARAHLRLRRCARREAAVISSQVRSAQEVWNNEQEDRLVAWTALLAHDPARAVRELKRFGAGRRWLIDRWRFLAQWFVRDGYCHTPKLVDEAIRLLGMSVDYPEMGPLLGFKFKLWCVLGNPVLNQDVLDWLMSNAVLHPDYFAEHGHDLPDPEVCREEVQRTVAAEITALELDEEEWLPDERAEANGACERALLPADGPESRLALRYETTTRATRDKALKMLEHLQNERFAVEAVADDAPALEPTADTPTEPAPNEPDTPPEPQPSADDPVPCASSTETNSDDVNAGPIGIEAIEKIVAIETTERPGSAIAIVTPAGADSPPA
jgi:hypothetical protein